MATEGNEERTEATEPTDELAELRAVVAKAKAGDATVLPRLRTLLDANQYLVKHYGDVARQAEAAWVALAGGNNLYMRETFARAADARRAELTRPGATPVERLLVERTVACWLQVNYFSATEANALAAGDTYRQLQYHAKRVERSQRMHLAALGALVTFQRLTPVTGHESVARERGLAGTANDQPVPAEPVTVTPPRVLQSIVEEDEPVEQETEERIPVRIAVGG